MDKRSKIALYIIGGIVLLMILAEITKPKALNWRDSYSAVDKIPLGCFVLYNELKTFNYYELLDSETSIYEYLKEEDSTPKTLLFINNYIRFDDEESKALLNFVEQGNSVFISAQYSYGNLADTLNYYIDNSSGTYYKQTSKSSFSSPFLKDESFVYEDVIENNYFLSIDTLKTTILGHVEIENDDELEVFPNYIKTAFGDNNGYFYIHSNPYAFSNYHMLKGGNNYVSTVLSFLPNQQIVWDNHYKSGRKVITTPLRYILLNKPLKWALHISLITLILFVIFKGKRTQRIIPILKPLQNHTVDFTRTIGQLYYQHGDFTNIINQKIEYFLEYSRTHYYLNTSQLSSGFIEKLAIKSGNTKEQTKALVDYLVFLKSKVSHTENELIELNKKIEHFTNSKL